MPRSKLFSDPEMPLLRVILDTNVWISGVFWRGTPYQVLRAWRNEQYELVRQFLDLLQAQTAQES
jgi:predicted nucleic acid-binding protein